MVIRKLFIVPLVALLVACGAASKSGKSVNHHANPSIAYTPLSKNASQRFKYFYLEAINQQNKGNYAGAFDLLNHCQEINPNAAEVYFKSILRFPQTYWNAIGKRYAQLGLAPTREDMERLVTGVYTNEKNYYKRPLSKYVSDIAKDEGL